MGVHVKVAGGLVFDKRKEGTYVLLLEDRFGKVTLPKGHMEQGEILEETAVREVYEETGIATRILSPIGKVTYEFTDSHRGESGVKDAYYYLMEKVDGDIQPQWEEVKGATFVPVAQVENEVRSRGYANNLAIFQNALAMISDMDNNQSDLADWIDHTLLKPEATDADIEKLCKEAAAYQFASVCINPIYVELAAELLASTPVKVCTVIGFPLGANVTTVKVAEAIRAIHDGAEEVDMVIAVGKLRAGDLTYVEKDIRAVVEAAGDKSIVKVILETGLLTPEEQVAGAECALRAGAHFVKTSTGFIAGGATEDAVARLRQTVGDRLGVKASGGIRTRDDALAMVRAGASRIGASAGPKLMTSPRFLGWD